MNRLRLDPIDKGELERERSRISEQNRSFAGVEMCSCVCDVIADAFYFYRSSVCVCVCLLWTLKELAKIRPNLICERFCSVSYSSSLGALEVFPVARRLFRTAYSYTC